MDPTNPASSPIPPSQPPDLGINTPSVAPDRKKVLIIVGAVLVIILVFSAVFLLASNPNRGESDRVGQDLEKSSNGKVEGPTKIPSPEESAEGVALGFYSWYVSHPSPLASRAFKTRRDISDDYKQSMEAYVARGLPSDYDPVFHCGDSILPKNVVPLGAEYNENQDLALVILQEVATERDLFQIKLQKISGAWFVQDVWCANP